MKKLIAVVLIIFAGGFGIAVAQKDKAEINEKTSWHKIGETTISFMAERYEIALLQADKFGYIKFKVMDAPIILMDLEVYFESGKKQYVDVNSLIKEPGESWVVKLNTGERNITKVVFVYKTLPNHKEEKALVQLWGFKQKSI
jgi:hypothetical protein